MGTHHWQDSHFGTEHWQDSHFGLDDGSDFGPRFDFGMGATSGTVDVDPDLGLAPLATGFEFSTKSESEFGLEPLGLAVTGVATIGVLAAVRHFFYGPKHGHHRRTHGKGGRSAPAARPAVHAAPANLTDSDGEYEALQVAAASDPYALGQPL
jgi:hypothetical protein